MSLSVFTLCLLQNSDNRTWPRSKPCIDWLSECCVDFRKKDHLVRDTIEGQCSGTVVQIYTDDCRVGLTNTHRDFVVSNRAPHLIDRQSP